MNLLKVLQTGNPKVIKTYIDSNPNSILSNDLRKVHKMYSMLLEANPKRKTVLRLVRGIELAIEYRRKKYRGELK